MVNKINYKSSVSVKFDFKEKTGTLNWNSIKERLNFEEGGVGYKSPIQEYLEHASTTGKYLTSDKVVSPRRMKFTIQSYNPDSKGYVEYFLKSNPRKLTLEVKGNSKQDFRISEIFDLNSLEKFILTGELLEKN